MSNNPWAGLASYQDPASGSTLLFCGRDNESYDLAALVDDNIFCTLYGKSGTGKTSLLNAGMFPRLRDMGYLPLSIRLGMEALDSTFQQCIAARLGKAATLQTADTVPLPADDQNEQWLWAWFARTRFVDAEGKVRFPVLVFDQFEEVFRSRRAEAETLLRQVHFMMDPSHSLGDNYDYNFRFLASIREDDLYLLEDSLDRHFMGDMKQCRYRLNALSDEGARDVILKPGEGLFAAGEQDAIVDTVIGIARSADGSINTNILSLVCSRIYDHYKRSGDSHISLDLVKRFVSSNPFEQFYNEVTESLGEKEKQFIEDRLVDAAGRRGSVSEPDFEKNVPNGAHLLEGTGRILQRVASGTEGRSYRIELIHDSFCAPLADQKLKRAARRRRRVIAALSAVALVVAAVAAYIVVASIRNTRQTREILIQQEKFYAKQASQLLDEGDTYTALLLLNELTDPDGPFAKIPLQPEAERQMRRAIQMYEDAEWQVELSLRNVGYIARTPQITPDGKYMVVSIPGGIKIINCQNGELESWIRYWGIKNPLFAISHNGGKLAALVKHDSIKLYDLPSGALDKSLAIEPYMIWEDEYLSFSQDDSHIIFPLSKVVRDEWGVGGTLDCLAGVDIDSCKHYIRYGERPITIEIPSRKGTIVSSATGKTVIVADEQTGRIITEKEFNDCLTYERNGDFWNDYLNYVCVNDNELLLQKEDGIYVYKIAEKEWKLLVSGTFDMRICAEMKFGISQNFLMATNKDSVFLFHLNDGSFFSKFHVDTNRYNYASLNYYDNSIILVNRRVGNLMILKHPGTGLSSASIELMEDSLLKQDATFVGYDSIMLGYSFNDHTICWAYTTEGNYLSDDSICNDIFTDAANVSPNGRYIIFYNFTSKDKKYVYIYDRWEKCKKTPFRALPFSGFFSEDNEYYYFLNYDTSGTHTFLRKLNIKTGDTVDCAEIPYRCSIGDRNTNNRCLLLMCFPGSFIAVLNLDTKKIMEEKSINNIGTGSINNKNIKYTPDGRYLIVTTNSRSICLYDAMTLEIVDSCKKGLSYVLAFSPDSKYVLLDVDNRMELWSLLPLRPVWKIENKTYTELKNKDIEWLPTITFSKDGKSIIFYSEKMYKDGRIYFERIPVLSQEELKARVRELANGRKLTEEEKNLLME